MSFDLSLPVGAQTNGALANQLSANKQNMQKPTFEVIDPIGGQVGASETASLVPVVQVAETEIENRANERRITQQLGLPELSLEAIIKSAVAEGGTRGLAGLDATKSDRFEPIENKVLTSQEASFEKSLEFVRSMNDPSGGEGESRLV